MKKTVFEFDCYKKYVISVLKAQPGGGHGFRSRVAEAAGCRVAYVSQVLNGDAHFSLEQGECLNSYFYHSADESNYFLLLIQYGRAGSSALRSRLGAQVRQLREKTLVLKDRVDIKATLSPIDQAVYYSAWYYAAIHILVMIPAYREQTAIADYLKLTPEKVSEVIQFLTSVGLVKMTGNKVRPGISRIFLGNDSPMIARHHSNWRIRAIDSLDRGSGSDVHLSTVLSLSSEDALKLKELLVKSIEQLRAVAKTSSKDEEVLCLCMDLFKV